MAAIMKLIFLRHGQAQQNLQEVGRLSRLRDQLTTTGYREARLAGQALADQPLAGIYTSPRFRACQTAQIVANYFPQLRVIWPDRRLSDRNFKPLEPAFWLRWANRSGLVSDTGLERRLQPRLGRRHWAGQMAIAAFLKQLRSSHDRQTILVVAHLPTYWALVNFLFDQGLINPGQGWDNYLPTGAWRQFDLSQLSFSQSA